MCGPCATRPREPCQAGDRAALSGSFCVPQQACTSMFRNFFTGGDFHEKAEKLPRKICRSLLRGRTASYRLCVLLIRSLDLGIAAIASLCYHNNRIAHEYGQSRCHQNVSGFFIFIFISESKPVKPFPDRLLCIRAELLRRLALNCHTVKHLCTRQIA